MSVEPKSETLRALYWRDEILQVMFWLRGEGFGEQVDPHLLERFLGVSYPTARQRFAELLDRLGLVEPATPPPATSDSAAEVLRRLASGELEVDEAASLLG